MAQDLQTRAERQLDLNKAALAEATTALGEARTEQDRRVADPSELTPQQWATGTGARQHVELARAAVAAELAIQAAARVRLSQVSSPADAETYEAELRASLTRLAGLQVLLRHGREREQSAAHRVRALGAVVDAAAARVSASQRGVTQATVDQKAALAALDALDDPPLDTIVADSSALRAGATFTDARDRLTELLPDALRERAHQRYAESTKLVDEALEHLGTARAAEEKATAEITPATMLSTADASFRTALAALSAYVASAAAELAAAGAALEAVAAVPDLSQEQVNALDQDGRADAVAAAANEQALADAVAEVAILQQAVDDAILSARIDDPDSDPETNEDVIAARAALDDEATQQALADARAAYDQARRDELDAWEVEVPDTLWEAVAMFESASATLDRLASTPVRDGLVSGLETAQNAYADALDDADVALRRLQVARLEAAVRGARALAAAELSADRAGQYTRGDGPAGRTADQL